MLGFVLDFRTNAKKVFKDTTKFVVDFISGWGKNNKSIGKNLRGVNVHLSRSIRNVKEWARTMRDSGPTITDVIDQIGEKFGGVAGILADTLARPGALMAIAATTATKSGMDMEATMVSLRREVALTDEEWERYRDVILKVSESMHAPMTQVQGLAKAFGAANLDIENYPELMEAAISVNRLTGQETAHVAANILRMSRDLKMSASDIHDYFNEAYAAAQISNHDLSTIYGSVDEITALVSQYMPSEMKKGMTEVTKVFAASADMFDNQVIYKLMRGMFNIQDPAWGEIRRLASAAGSDAIAEMQQAISNGDISGAFKKLIEGARSINADSPDGARFLQTIGPVLGFTAQQLRQLAQIDTSMFDIMDSAGESAKQSNKMLKDTKDLVTITERWHKVWADIQRVLLPLGEVIVELLHPILAFFGDIISWVSKFTSSLGPVGKRILAIGIALATWKMWLTPVITLLEIMGANLLGGVMRLGKFVGLTRAAGVAASGVGGSILGWGKSLVKNNILTQAITRNFGNMRASMTALNGAGVGFSGTLMDVTKSTGGLLVRLGKIALPFILAYTAVEALDAAFKNAFNFSFLDNLSKKLGIPRSVIAGILSYLLLSKGVLGKLAPLTKLFTAALSGSWAMAKKLWLTLVALPGAIGRAKAASGGLTKSLMSMATSFPTKMSAGFKAFSFNAGRAAGSVLRIAGPIAIVVGLLMLVDKVMKRVFGVGVVQGMVKAVMKLAEVLGKVLAPILEAVAWVIEKAAEGWANIIDGFVWLFSNDQEWAQYSRDRAKNNQLAEKSSMWDDITGMFGGGSDKSSEEGASVDPSEGQFDLSPVTNEVTGQTVSARESFGTDDIIAAIYNSNSRLEEILKKIAYDPISSTSSSNGRHSPIPDRRSM